MAIFHWCNPAVEKIAEGNIRLGTDALKIALTNVVPTAAVEFRSQITELANGNGYTTGGNAVTLQSSTQTGGVYRLLVTAPPLWTGGTSGMGPFQHCVLYKNTGTAATDPVLGWWSNASPITLASGQTFTASVDAISGLIQAQGQ